MICASGAEPLIEILIEAHYEMAAPATVSIKSDRVTEAIKKAVASGIINTKEAEDIGKNYRVCKLIEKPTDCYNSFKFYIIEVLIRKYDECKRRE